CNLVVKFDNEIIMQMARSNAFSTSTTMIRNSAAISPKTSSGILWIGSVYQQDYIADAKQNFFPAARVDDVSFTRMGMENGTTGGICSIGNS
ncbi:hypothetical protein GQ44DRAFT_629222, partial [Phaeosphaeriaceae sp. PMI808]